MRTWNRRFWICLAGTATLTASVIFLPRYFSRSLDLGKFNQVEMTAPGNNFAFLEPSSNSVLETIRAFQSLNQKDTELVLLGTFDQSTKMNNDLLEQVFDQAMYVADIGMIPLFGARGYELAEMLGLEPQAYYYWADQMLSARYYSMVYARDGNTKEMLNFWYLCFGDNKTYEYRFVVNAVTYKLYYAEIYNQYSDYAADCLDSIILYGDYPVKEEPKTDSSSLNISRQNEAMALIAEFWPPDGLFADSCAAYYEADDYKLIDAASLNDSKILLMVLNYGEGTAYVEQRILSQNGSGLRGVGIGIQNLADDIHRLADSP